MARLGRRRNTIETSYLGHKLLLTDFGIVVSDRNDEYITTVQSMSSMRRLVKQRRREERALV